MTLRNLAFTLFTIIVTMLSSSGISEAQTFSLSNVTYKTPPVSPNGDTTTISGTVTTTGVANGAMITITFDVFNDSTNKSATKDITVTIQNNTATFTDKTINTLGPAHIEPLEIQWFAANAIA